jgi:hypothetical protein
VLVRTFSDAHFTRIMRPASEVDTFRTWQVIKVAIDCGTKKACFSSIWPDLGR